MSDITDPLKGAEKQVTDLSKVRSDFCQPIVRELFIRLGKKAAEMPLEVDRKSMDWMLFYDSFFQTDIEPLMQQPGFKLSYITFIHQLLLQVIDITFDRTAYHVNMAKDRMMKELLGCDEDDLTIPRLIEILKPIIEREKKAVDNKTGQQ